MKYKPRHDLLLVERVEKQTKTQGGLVLPEDSGSLLGRFRIIVVGPDVKDLKVGDVVLAEDMFTPISKISKEIGMLNQRYIHLIEGETND